MWSRLIRRSRTSSEGGAFAPPFLRSFCTRTGIWTLCVFDFLGTVKRGKGVIDVRTGVVLDRKLELVLDLLTPGNALVARVMLCTGLRVGDVLLLTPDQIRPSVRVTERKTGKSRTVRIPRALCAAVLARASDRWAFPSPKDPAKHRTRQAVWADIKRAQRACRFRQNLGTHSMRKAYAVRLMHRYQDLGRVQQALLHDRPEVTMLYALADKLCGLSP